MGEIKFLDTLVEVSGDAASDAGSTPAASTKPYQPLQAAVYSDSLLPGSELGCWRANYSTST